MLTKVLNLRRRDTGDTPGRLPTAAQIAHSDSAVLCDRRRKPNCINARPRGIPEDRAHRLAEELTIYPEGNRAHVFKARVIRHDKMPGLVGVQGKIFNHWLTRGKVPYAGYCVVTGKRGYPPKAYLLEEAQALVTALNTHYKEHYTFRDTDTGLRRSVHTALKLVRDRKAKELGYAQTS